VNMFRKILMPLVPLYYGIMWFRNFCFDNKLLESRSYNFPVICVGNLNVGGTGKTPMIEYLIRLLENKYEVTTLSRGYGRRTKGFIIADKNATPQLIGDEPYQFYQKFPNILVTVGEDRRDAIESLIKEKRAPKLLLLDDAFQHRQVYSSFKILLTSYDNLYVDDVLLPVGNLRESKSGSKRADIIVVTKCPKEISEQSRNSIKQKLSIQSHQQLFFSYIGYSKILLSKQKQINLKSLINIKFTLITGIANPKSLVNYLSSEGLKFKHLVFRDHHDFKHSDFLRFRKEKLIITTEKDYVKLENKIDHDKLFYLPIQTKMINSNNFNSAIQLFLTNF
jgi:tetraacyldisaccharide 4'-kinase